MVSSSARENLIRAGLQELKAGSSPRLSVKQSSLTEMILGKENRAAKTAVISREDRERLLKEKRGQDVVLEKAFTIIHGVKRKVMAILLHCVAVIAEYMYIYLAKKCKGCHRNSPCIKCEGQYQAIRNAACELDNRMCLELPADYIHFLEYAEERRNAVLRAHHDIDCQQNMIATFEILQSVENDMKPLAEERRELRPTLEAVTVLRSFLQTLLVVQV